MENFIKQRDVNDIYNIIVKFLTFSELEKYTKEYMEKDKDRFSGISDHNAPEDITFSDLFRMTRCNLVITGSNVSQHEPKYFSVYHTPNLSVVHAVAISMSIPFAFKPVFIERNVHEKESESYNNSYKGLYVDGGIVNNFPIHAFNRTIEKEFQINNKAYKYHVANTEPRDKSGFKNNESGKEVNILGFRLFDSYFTPDVRIEKIYGDGKKEDRNNMKVLFEYFADIYGTIRFDSTEGQIFGTSIDNVLKLETVGIGLMDFASPALDEKRGTKAPVIPEKVRNEISKIFRKEVPQPKTMAEYKKLLNLYAYQITKNKLNPIQ